MLQPHEPGAEEVSVGGSLEWRERSDGHWLAKGLGGHFDLSPSRDQGGFTAWWIPHSGTPHDLGHYSTLGGAMGAAKRHADGIKYAAEVAECDHTHPASVPMLQCQKCGTRLVQREEVAAVGTRMTTVSEDSDAKKWKLVDKGWSVKNGWVIQVFKHSRTRNFRAVAASAKGEVLMSSVHKNQRDAKKEVEGMIDKEGARESPKARRARAR